MSRRRDPDVGARLDALAHAVELAKGRCDPVLLAPAQAMVAHASARRRLSPERTVVALAGGTGSGKSTLFNALAGAPLAPTGVRRPTTSRSRAAIWPAPGAENAPTGVGESAALLDWLDVRDRDFVAQPAGAALSGLMLVDLPDFDSTAQAHRMEAERLSEVVDLLVWVLDPQKYADAAVHDRYLRPLSTHGDVMMIVLNQVDRLDRAAADSCQRHLQQLLAADGLPRVPIIATSATRGDGLAQLHDELATRVRTRTAAVQRLHADIDAAVAELAPLCASSADKHSDKNSDRHGDKHSKRDSARTEEALVRGLAEAAGADTVAAAAAASYRLRATARMRALKHI
jgi:GTP-binding protein EngB required for normal cell division